MSVRSADGMDRKGRSSAQAPVWRRVLSRMVPRGAATWMIAWAAFLVAAAVITWIRDSAWLTDNESASTTIRNLGLFVFGAVGLPVAIWRSVIAARQAEAAQRQSKIAEQNLLNDRFQRGAEMLGHPDIASVRIAGIHALARLGAEYPDVFHLPVMHTIAAFVVDRTKGARAEPEQELVDPESLPASDIIERVSPWIEEAIDSSGHHPFLVSLAAGREVGTVPELAKDVGEAMRSIAQRGKNQVAVENDGTFRMNLADACIPGLIFHQADFSGFDFTKADMRRVRGWRARFVRARLAGADLSAANLYDAVFRDADMRRVNLTAAKLIGADMRNADLGLVDLVAENLWKGTIFPSRLVGTLLAGADLRKANLVKADMRGALLGCAKLDNADFGSANLSGADLRSASLRGTELGRADLTNANMGCTNLTGANLSNAMLAGANLDGANLSGTDFSPRLLGRAVRGLTQKQLDQAIAEPGRPPELDGALDSETNEPLVWRSDSEGEGAPDCDGEQIGNEADPG